MDDLFLLWKGSVEQLTEFVMFINNSTDFLKFTVNYSHVGVNFLDVYVEKDTVGKLSTKMYRKECHANKLLRKDSMHPKYIFRNVAQNQFLRLSRLNVKKEDFEKQTEMVRLELLDRGYDEGMVKKNVVEVERLRETRAKPYFSRLKKYEQNMKTGDTNKLRICLSYSRDVRK